MNYIGPLCGSDWPLSSFAATPPIAGTRFPPSLQCTDPAAYDADEGALLMSVCWTSRDLPASLLAAAASSSTPMLRATLPRVARYGVASMAPGSYRVTVSGSASSAGLTLHPAATSAADIAAGPFAATPQSGGTGVAGSSVALPNGGASAITMWFDVPVSAAASAPASSNGNSAGASGTKTVYTVALRLSGPPNPPPAASVCKCPTAADAVTGACPSGLATLAASSLTYATTSTATTAAPAAPVQCVPPPQYLPTSRRLIFSTCWRYSCLPSAFARLPYELVITPPYGSSTAGGALAAGLYSLRAALPGASVGMALEMLPAAGNTGSGGGSSNETAMVQWLSYSASSDQGGGTTVVVPPGGVSQLRVRVRVPFDLDLDNASGTSSRFACSVVG